LQVEKPDNPEKYPFFSRIHHLPRRMPPEKKTLQINIFCFFRLKTERGDSMFPQHETEWKFVTGVSL